MEYKISNGIIEVAIAEHGGELVSLKKGEQEYIWCGDAKYWKRHAPILFPIVGKVWNDEYRVDGKVYHMSQHGFARDSEFMCTTISYCEKFGGGMEAFIPQDHLGLMCEEFGGNELYPYAFTLSVKYFLNGNRLDICWTVRNNDSKKMYFQIGAHPAFNYPEYVATDKVHGYLKLYNGCGKEVSELQASYIGNGGKDVSLDKTLQLKDGKMELGNDTFKDDAIILENHQVKDVVLLGKDEQPYLKVSCYDAQLYGLWAPHKEGCPFMCIEPWCGRVDAIGFNGDISEREWIQELDPQKEFDFWYSIEVL